MTLREAIVAKAKTYLGTPYSKLDCSAFVRAVFRNFGYELPRVSATQAKHLYDIGLGEKIPKSMTVGEVLKLLKPGNIIALANPKYPERWEEIHHIEIYIGDGKVIESAGEGVKIRGLWETSKWQIVVIADITSVLKYDGEAKESEEKEVVINKESTREERYKLQQMLVGNGYDIGTFKDFKTGEPTGCDGYIGTYTLNAIKAVQAEAGFEQTGEGDGRTILYLANGSSAEVKELEEQLRVIQTQTESLSRQLEEAHTWETKVKAVVNG